MLVALRVIFGIPACFVLGGLLAYGQAAGSAELEPTAENAASQDAVPELGVAVESNPTAATSSSQQAAAGETPADEVDSDSPAPADASVGEGDETPVELPEGYQEELDARIERFAQKRLELEKAIADQREIFIRYANREQYSAERRRAYLDQRDKVRVLLDETYLAALEILQMGFDKEATTYMVTLIQHRHARDIYDGPTMEGAARLIDGGSKLKFMFEAAARSAVVSGEFDMAKQIYEALPDEEQDELDTRLEYSLDQLRAEYESEAALREVEIKEDRLPRVLLKTTQGDVVVELFLDQAPSTVSHFIRLVESGFYDGRDFFQVIDHLLALAGDPETMADQMNRKFLVDEHERPDSRKGLRGSLIMAKIPMTGAQSGGFFPNSASSQFAILLTPVVGVSKQQTIFGTVIEGMEVVSRLRRVDPHKEKKKGEVQIPPDSIIEAKVLRRPETLPEPQYVQP